MNRRSFLQIFSLGAVAAGVSTVLGNGALAEERRKPRKTEGAASGDALCEPGKGVAQAINYQHSHADVKDAKLKVDKAGTPWAQQFCKGCSFYSVKNKELGSCTLLAGCTVKANGWCASWNKKA